MVLHRIANASIFAKYGYALSIIEIHFRTRIVMKVEYIATSIEVATAGWIHQACGIHLLGPLRYFLCLKLAPSFVEWHPNVDAWVSGELFNYLLPLLAIVCLALFRACKFCTIEVLMHLPLRVSVAVRHILPYQDTHLVAITIPQFWLYLHVLAYHIEAPLLGLIEVVNHCFVTWSGIESIGPPTLVERSEVKYIGIVKLNAHYAVGVALGAHLAHCHIALYAIHLFAVNAQRYLHII